MVPKGFRIESILSTQPETSSIVNQVRSSYPKTAWVYVQTQGLHYDFYQLTCTSIIRKMLEGNSTRAYAVALEIE